MEYCCEHNINKKNQLCVHVDGASLAVMSIDLGSEFMKMGLVKVRL